MSQRERPILFSAPLVRSILAGTKTVTRRPVRLPGSVHHAEVDAWAIGPEGWEAGYRGDSGALADTGIRVPCPFGASGDRLWGRETFYVNHIDHVRGPLPKTRPAKTEILYRADGDFDAHFEVVDAPELAVWRPSIHMPRWASRITLDVTGVSVERLQDITEEDARAEGIQADDISRVGLPCYSARQNFAKAWSAIYGDESWDANGWVWRVAFKRIEVQ